MVLQMEEHKLDKITFPCVISISGDVGCGKSYLTQYLVNYFSVVKPVFNRIKYFTGRFSSDELRNYHMELLTLQTTLQYEQMRDNVIIFDGMLDQLKNDEYFHKMLSMYRFTKTTIIIASRVKPIALLRTCVNYAFVFRTINDQTIQQYFDWFNKGVFHNYEEYKALFLAVTKEKYTSMLYIEDEDDSDENFISFKIPASVNKSQK